jgi:hypothetical protein
MALLVAAFEGLVAGRDRFASDLAESWRYKAVAATRGAARAEVLCFGDSMVEFGVVPAAVEGGAGGRAYNLAVHAGHPAASYFLLRRVLGAGGRPRALVVDVMPQQLVKSPLAADLRRAWPELAGPVEALDLARRGRDPGFFAATMLARVLPSFKARHEIRRGLAAALGGESYSAREIVRVLRRNWDVNRGAQVMPEPRGGRPAFGPRSPQVFPDAPRYDPRTVSYVRRFLRLARSRGVAVYWLIPPLRPEAQRMFEDRGQNTTYTRFVRALQARFPGLTVVDGRHSGYDPALFVDAVHLNRRGALALSSDLAALLDRTPGRGPEGPSWVALSTFRDRPIRSPVEDLDASRLAIGSRRGGAVR